MRPEPQRTDTEALEAALQREGDEHYVLILFVAGTTPNSMRAIANTRRMCERFLANRHSLTIIDMYQQPELAKLEQIVAAPTLVRKHPKPMKKLVGTVGDVVRMVLPVHLSPPGDAAPRDAS